MNKIYTRFNLVERITRLQLFKKNTPFTESTIVPYIEKPTCNEELNVTGKLFSAHELFAMFTADVINENAVFTR